MDYGRYVSCFFYIITQKNAGISLFILFDFEGCNHFLCVQVIENQAAVDFIRRTKDPKIAAKQLIDYAIRENSKDDISCVVVRFQ